MLEREKMIDEINALYNEVSRLQCLLNGYTERRRAMKPIIVNMHTELCPNCKAKVKFTEPTGFHFQGASESYYDWRTVVHNFCPNCGIRIDRDDTCSQ